MDLPASSIDTDVSAVATRVPSFWPTGLGTWAQAAQVLIALVNVAVVVYVFWRTRSDKQRELQLAVDSFWLQKVIVEPHTKKLDELHATLVQLLRKAEKQAHTVGNGPLPACEAAAAVSSYSSIASDAIEQFRFGILPLITVVVDRQAPAKADPPSRSVDLAIDHLEEVATFGIDQVLGATPVTIDRSIKDLATGRTELLKLLFGLHQTPFRSNR